MSHTYEEQEILWYYNIPDLSRESWDGIKYESVRYGWDELDYRFSVDYPSVPEPSAIGFIMGATLLILTLLKRK
jgi:hypothetical protein